uniref:Glycoside hydrolase 35 catalytic domain-containing protein n=1 Tax=Romanomermis culicivorax TaxID=13658 RepID=A0A915JV96_ROMCU
MVAEYWTGWFDQWGEQHHTFELETFEKTFQIILERNASFNLYMFVGGTNFGFTNGANIGAESAYNPVITSYDYDALLTEDGQLTPKYRLARNLIAKYSPEKKSFSTNVIKNDQKSYHQSERTIFLNSSRYSLLTDILRVVKSMGQIEKPLFVEHICAEIGEDCADPLHGFVVYRNQIPPDCESLVLMGMIADRMQILVDGRTVSTLFDRMNYKIWKVDLQLNRKVDLPSAKIAESRDLILLVENMGRAHYTVLDNQRKGFQGDVKCRTAEGKLEDFADWTIYGLAFDDLALFRDVAKHNHGQEKLAQPAFYHFEANLVEDDTIKDYFLNFETWKKGVAFVNDFNLGRYWNIGSQMSLYLPGTLLRKGNNL